MSGAAALDLGPRPRRRRLVGLTPLIDVVFLLLIFFMLAARLQVENELSLAAAQGGGAAYSGPPRLVTIGGESLTLNGARVDLADLPARARALPPGPEAPIVLRVRPGAEAQRLVAAIDALRAGGLSAILLAE